MVELLCLLAPLGLAFGVSASSFSKQKPPCRLSKEKPPCRLIVDT